MPRAPMGRVQYASSGCPRGGRVSPAPPPRYYRTYSAYTVPQHAFRYLDTNFCSTSRCFYRPFTGVWWAYHQLHSPLRGPDEISHFVRIYSYARGEILPTTEIDGRKGILVEPGLYSELQYFRTAGEVFARHGGLSYHQLVAGYRNPIGSSIANESDQVPIF